MGTLQGSWIWYELMTPDVAGSKAFYEAVVRWSVTPGSPETGGYGFIKAADEAIIGGVVELSDDVTSRRARPRWIGYIGVNDVDASLSAIATAGGRCLLPARDVPIAGRIAMVADPGGAPFYIMAPTPPSGGGESTSFTAEINHGHCGWNELLAGDAGREVAFYTGLFGWLLPEPMDMGEMGKYQFVAHDDVTVGAIMQKMPNVPAPIWAHYFWVHSIAAAKSAIEANGGKVIREPHQVPGDNWIVQGIDPQGAMFNLVGGE